MAEHPATDGLVDDREVASGRTRRCWRCRGAFAVDDGVTDGEMTDWWTCAPCHASLLPAAAGPVATDASTADTGRARRG